MIGCLEPRRAGKVLHDSAHATQLAIPESLEPTYLLVAKALLHI